MLRIFYQSDIPQILAIENAVHLTPWTEETFRACFQAGYMGWVIEIEKKIIGFIIVSLTPDECHVLNICVLPDYQRLGWGEKLLNYILNHAREYGVGIIYLEVRRSNIPAISLYKKMQFRLIGERKDYYPSGSNKEDALIFARNL